LSVPLRPVGLASFFLEAHIARGLVPLLSLPSPHPCTSRSHTVPCPVPTTGGALGNSAPHIYRQISAGGVKHLAEAGGAPQLPCIDGFPWRSIVSLSAHIAKLPLVPLLHASTPRPATHPCPVRSPAAPHSCCRSQSQGRGKFAMKKSKS
jgi:hypothetical protein